MTAILGRPATATRMRNRSGGMAHLPAGPALDMSLETEILINRTFVEPRAHPPGAAHVPTFKFSTQQLARPDQFPAWRHSFAPMIEIAARDNTDGGFAGTQHLWDMGSLAFGRIRTGALTFSNLSRYRRHNPLDHWTLTLLLRGNMSTITPTGAFQADAGTVQIHTLAGSFMGNVTDSEMLILFVPRDTCHEVASALTAAEFAALETGLGHLLADYMANIARRIPTLHLAELPSLVKATQAMMHACISPTADAIEEAQAPIAVALLEKARRLVQARLFDPELGAEMLRRELGISRTRLYNLFESSGGVVRYIQHRRLLDAHSVLADPNDRRLILEIAEQRGFSDGVEFSRAFRREFGYSPSEVRKGSRNAATSPPRTDLDTISASDRLGALLRRLQN